MCPLVMTVKGTAVRIEGYLDLGHAVAETFHIHAFVGKAPPGLS
jgi:hypothetical protein